MDEREYYVNEIEKIQISEEKKQQILQYTGKEINRLLWPKLGAVAAVAAVVLALFAIPSPLSDRVRAYCELAVNTINGMIYGEHEDVTPYVTQIMQTGTDGDLSVQLNEVMLDGDHLIWNCTVTSTEPRFINIEDSDGETYEGYYDLGIQKITINGSSIEYTEDEVLYDGFLTESTDSYTYPVGGEHCLHELEKMLSNPEEMLQIQLKVVARALNGPDQKNWDYRYFTYNFTVKNRELQLETKEISIDRTFVQDDVTITLDKLCINTYSQKIYFHVTGMPERKYHWMNHIEDDPYQFTINGTDNKKNGVFSEIEEILDGDGYFELYTCSDTEGLDYNVQYYDFQMDYMWDDPDHIFTRDEDEGIWHGKEGTVGEPFRVDCRQ